MIYHIKDLYVICMHWRSERKAMNWSTEKYLRNNEIIFGGVFLFICTYISAYYKAKGEKGDWIFKISKSSCFNQVKFLDV